jgi:enoyl-[acyl-carrier protein] reductase I
LYAIDLEGKNALVFGVANQRSIAWHIARALDQAGASVTLSYINERIRSSVEKLSGQLSSSPTLIECDVSDDASVASAFGELESEVGSIDIVVHSIAFANRDDLGGPFIDTPREGFRIALDISAYSLVSVARAAAPLMKENGGSIVTMTFQASERVFPGYNVMGTAKAALENEVRQLSWDLGRDNIRINAISAGPVDTLSSRVISGYRDMKRAHADRSPMGRNITHDEVANTALFLCSDMSSGITGEVLHVDTGYNVMGI